MERRTLVAAVVLVVLVALAVTFLVLGRSGEPPRPSKLAFGISGEQPADFRDPRFRALGLSNARVQVSFDLHALGEVRELPGLRDERRRLDEWFAAARAAGIESVIVAFKAERDRPDLVPGTDRYRQSVEATLRHLDAGGYGPMIKQLSPWNEPDLHKTLSPERAGRYYREIEKICRQRGCRPLAGDFSDGHWTPAYFRRYLRAAGNATNWAWHAYGADGRRLRQFLAMLPAASTVEFTEQGGILHRPGAPDNDEAQAASDLAAAIRTARTTPQVASFYVYQWRGEKKPRWDSGLVSPGGRTRPSYCVFARAVGALAAAAQCPDLDSNQGPTP